MTEGDSVARKPRRTFTPEQKAEAVRLAEELGNVTQVARGLGIHRSSLVQWRGSTPAHLPLCAARDPRVHRGLQ